MSGKPQSATIVCALCGKEVPRVGTTQKYCRECGEALRHPRSTGRQRGSYKHKDPGGKTRRPMSIAEITALARAAGMTYGAYVAGDWEKAKAAGGGTPTT